MKKTKVKLHVIPKILNAVVKKSITLKLNCVSYNDLYASLSINNWHWGRGKLSRSITVCKEATLYIWSLVQTIIIRITVALRVTKKFRYKSQNK